MDFIDILSETTNTYQFIGKYMATFIMALQIILLIVVKNNENKSNITYLHTSK